MSDATDVSAPTDLSGNNEISTITYAEISTLSTLSSTTEADLLGISSISGAYLNEVIANVSTLSNISTFANMDLSGSTFSTVTTSSTSSISSTYSTIEASPFLITSSYSEVGITYLAEIVRQNVSSLISFDLSGGIYDITNSTIEGIDLLKISSINASYPYDRITAYIPNYSTLQERSTMAALQAHFDTTNDRTISTSMGILELPLTPDEKISTLIGFSTTSFALTLEDVLKVTNAYLTIENNNKLALTVLDYGVLKNNLFGWATQGFPESHPVYELPVTLPPGDPNALIRCSDGGLRNIWDYIVFFLGMSLQELMDSYTNLDGITLTYSVKANPYIVVLHVNRSA